MHALWMPVRPASRAAVALAALALVAGCGQASVDAGGTDPAGATTTPSSASSGASATTSGTSSSPATSSAGTPSAGGGATGSGTSSSVVITAPGDGERLPAGPVGIVGRATAPEGNLLWSITQADGTVLADGFTTGGANGEVGDFAVQQQVQAGSCAPCTARVWVPDDSAGEGSASAGPTSAASVTFTVG